jgi:hypothetical protein
MAETFQWLQFGPSGLEARAITDEPACPPLQLDGAAQSRRRRLEPMLAPYVFDLQDL